MTRARKKLTPAERARARPLIKAELALGVPRVQAVAIGLARARQGHPRSVRRRTLRKNPDGAQEQRVDAAITLYRRFTGHKPRRLTIAKLPLYGEAMSIGTLIGVAYEAVRDGERGRYYHEFRTRRPQLAASWDGRQLYILGGAYEMTEEGIVG